MTKYYYKLGNETLEFGVPTSVYSPEEDSEMLAKILASHNFRGMKLLDMGCGSGLLSIVANRVGASVTSCDINPEAVEATIQNAERNNASLRVLHSNLFSSIPDSEKFDIIVFNPPY